MRTALTSDEVFGIMKALDLSEGKSDRTLDKGDAWLAFNIIWETGVRRSAVAKRTINDDARGLKWKDVDWMRNVIISRSKRKIAKTPMTERLCKILLQRKSELGAGFQPDVHIIKFTRDTLSHYFKEAMKKAGVDKPGAVHIIRHTVPLVLLEAGANAYEVKEWMNHESMSTTDIYVHMRDEKLQKLAKQRGRSG